jgi:hypothetical protein
MEAKPDAVDTAQSHGERVAHSRGFEWFARSGFVARGFIYGIIGVLALKLALPETSGSTTSQQGALQQIAQEPFGEWLLIAMAVGLAGYAIWRLIRAAIGHGPESEESGLDRIGGAVSGILYGVLCATAVSILIDSGSSSSGGASQTTGGVLGWTGGTWIVGIGGAILVGVGLEQAYKGLKQKFLEKSKTEQMSPRVEQGFTFLGVFGHLARAVVFVLTGYFLIKAAIDFNPQEAVTIDGALSELADASYGPVLLGIVSAGLIGFGLYSLVDARFRKI